MKKLLSLFLISLLCNGCSKASSNQATLLITSDSSVGIRAFQDRGAAAGKIVIQNTGNSPLKNLALSLLNVHSDVSVTTNNCSTSLSPGSSCYYTVRYQPKFAPNAKDNLSDQLITFVALAEDTHNTRSQDSYTMDLQAVAHHSWLNATDINFTPSGTSDSSLISVSKENAHVLYSYGLGPNGENVVLRSTDGWHWSIVGANWSDLLGSIGHRNINSYEIGADKNQHIYVHFLAETSSANKSNYDGIAQYDGKNWHLMEDLNQAPVIKAFIVKSGASDNLGTSAFITKFLVTKNGDLYIGLPGISAPSSQNGGVLKFNGKHWDMTSYSWPYGSVNELQQGQDGEIYAATDMGVVKFDGKQWSPLGKPVVIKASQDNPTDWTVPVDGLLQTPNGDWYLFGSHAGVMKYNVKTQAWDIMGGKGSAYGDPAGWSNVAFYHNTLYMYAWDTDQIQKYDAKTDKWIKALPEISDDDFPDAGDTSEYLYNMNGVLYISANDTLFRYDGQRWVTITNHDALEWKRSATPIPKTIDGKNWIPQNSWQKVTTASGFDASSTIQEFKWWQAANGIFYAAVADNIMHTLGVYQYYN